MRACEVAAIASHDRVWMGGRFVDPRYARRRERALITAIDCLASGGVLVCRARLGPRERFDLRLTELDDLTLALKTGSATARNRRAAPARARAD